MIGADVGSQSVKVLMMDPDGAAVTSATAECPMSHPAPGWAEQHPDDWTHALARGVRAVREQASVAR